jgi:hypothetical protein
MDLVAPPNVADPKSLITEKLSSAIHGFLDASVEVWPQDALLSALHTTCKTLTKEDLCNTFAKVFDKDSLMLAQDKNADVFGKNAFRP